MTVILWLRGLIVRAAPTCTLWEHNIGMDVLVFRPWPRWKISFEEIEEGGRGVVMAKTFLERHRRALERLPRPMPIDFAVEIERTDDYVEGRHGQLRLGFVLSGDSDRDRRMHAALRQSLWEATEWKRIQAEPA